MTATQRWVSIVAAIVCLPVGHASLAAADRPNIVFVYTDDQAPTAVGISGTGQLKTPHMDRLFHQGARLENSFVTTPVCSPSRAGLMTSRYGTELGITDWINPQWEPSHGLDPKTVTWPELLSDAGYRTGLVGKWHLGTLDRFHPTRTGFRTGGNTPKDPVLEFAGKTRQFEGFTPDILTDHAVDFVRRNRNRPFLLCLHFRAPHAAWLPVPDGDWTPYKDLDPTIPNPDYPRLDVAKVKRMTREYYASVASVDRNVGRLLAVLDQLELTDNTIIAFTSDHGYNLGHNGVWYKGNAQWQLTEPPPQRWPHIPSRQRPNLYDQSLRVPTAVRWPGVIEPGSVITETVTNLDWYPTLLAMVGAVLPRKVLVRGHSFLPLLRGEKVAWDNDLYAEYSMKHGAQTHMRAWRTPKWKLMVDFLNDGRVELYNLQLDPVETANLAESQDPDIQRVRKRLHGRIVQMVRQINGPALDAGTCDSATLSNDK